jgi:Zn finger protein HypA/HybF involved in hydrogenase expression
MMIDMLKNAKDLIAKGKKLNDPELIQMGIDLLQQYNPDQITPTIENNGGFRQISKVFNKLPEPQYVCDSCGHTMPVDKEGRKRCPACKKHALQIVNDLRSDPPVNVPDANTYHFQTRNTQASRMHYDENGNILGKLTRTEQVANIHNTYQDDLTEGFDKENEALKQITKVSPRTRKAYQPKQVVCAECGCKIKMHPLHAAGRAVHYCTECLRRKMRGGQR